MGFLGQRTVDGFIGVLKREHQVAVRLPKIPKGTPLRVWRLCGEQRAQPSRWVVRRRGEVARRRHTRRPHDFCRGLHQPLFVGREWRASEDKYGV